MWTVGSFSAKGNKHGMRFYRIIFLVLVVDQVSKIYIRSRLQIGESIELWKGVLHLTRYENSGIMMGMLQGYGRYFVPVAVLITIAAVYLKSKDKINGRIEEAAIAFFVGGALGNAIDRTLFNQVTDFISFQFRDGILNLSDYAINIGVILLIISLFLSKRKKTT